MSKRPSPPTDPNRQAQRGWQLFAAFVISLAIIFVAWLQYHGANLFSDKALLTWDPRTGSKEQQYLDWFLISLGATLLYLIANVSRFLKKPGEAQFWDHTAWYFSTLIRGPFIAVIVLWLLTNLSFGTAPAGGQGEPGLQISIGELPAVVLQALAFILGFYSRVAIKQLDIFTESLMGQAWRLANDTFVVVPNSAQVVFGRQVQFAIDPRLEVIWTAPFGTIDASSGLYTAPTTGVQAGTRDVVRASLRSNPAISAVATVTLVPFVISGPDQLKYGVTQTYLVDPLPEGGVVWSVNPSALEGGTVQATGLYQAPQKESATKEVTLLAKSDKTGYTATLMVSLSE